MDSKDKELLLRDLAGRIAHSVKVEVIEDGLNLGTHVLSAYWLDRVGNKYYDIKPHLFSIKDALRSREFVEEFRELFPDTDATELDGPGGCFDWDGPVPLEDIDLLTDLLNRHKVDWRGLIKKGLAIDAAVSHVYEFIEQ
jgi:hypothetical protein